MFDGFWSGVFGGIFGPALVRWVGKYKYLTVFAIVAVGVHIVAFAQDCMDAGLHVALARAREFTFTPVGIFVPMAMGALAVICLFFCKLISGSGKKNPSTDANEDGRC